MRTTIDIDPPILKELKRLQKAEGKSLGKLTSELLAQALADRRKPKAAAEFLSFAAVVSLRSLIDSLSRLVISLKDAARIQISFFAGMTIL